MPHQDGRHGRRFRFLILTWWQRRRPLRCQTCSAMVDHAGAADHARWHAGAPPNPSSGERSAYHDEFVDAGPPPSGQHRRCIDAGEQLAVALVRTQRGADPEHYPPLVAAALSAWWGTDWADFHVEPPRRIAAFGFGPGDPPHPLRCSCPDPLRAIDANCAVHGLEAVLHLGAEQ